MIRNRPENLADVRPQHEPGMLLAIRAQLGALGGVARSAPCLDQATPIVSLL